MTTLQASFPGTYTYQKSSKLRIEASSGVGRQGGHTQTITPSLFYHPELSPYPPWFKEAVTQMRELLSLGENWNGYGEQPVHDSAFWRALGVLGDIGINGPRPDIVPTPDGGLQLEWMGAGFEIEVEIPPEGPAIIFISNPSGKETEHIARLRNGRIWRLLRYKITTIGA